jgi:hypothetical protein
MLPTLEQYKQGATIWKREYKGVGYSLSHHGVSDYSPHGTWCFYIFIQSNLFVNDEDFKLFNREAEITEFAGSFRENYSYYDVPDYGFHGGITWYSKERFVDREGKEQVSLKIGCDYSHLWDMEGGYSDGLDDVDRDAKALIDELVKMHPVKWRCQYSSKLDVPNEFYTAKNGARVHNSCIEKLKLDDSWEKYWSPKED